MLRSTPALVVLLLTLAAVGSAAESKSAPRPLPLTRPQMKQLIEDVKVRKPRIPLPELTAEEKEKLGERGSGYESRLRQLYLLDGEARGGLGAIGAGRPGPAGDSRPRDFTRNNDPRMTLDYAFKTQLFWIVSRTNNCQYCLGHQESKLLAAGQTEADIAALDGDWSQFDPARQAAFALARKLTYEPHRLAEADFVALRKHYNDLQILEMCFSVAGNNQINRWKEGAGVPQSASGGGFGRRGEPNQPAASHSYLTPTAEKYRASITKVAPVDLDPRSGEPSDRTVCRRPPLESRDEVERALAEAGKRAARLPLVEEATAREVLSDAAPQGKLPGWIRLLANFPRDGKTRIVGLLNAETQGSLSPLVKAQVSWIVARQDRAWYAVGLAKQRLKQLGQSDQQIYALDGSWEKFSPAQRAMFTLARNLAATPVVLTDDEVTAALRQTGPREVVQLISYTTGRAFFDRVTEAAALPLD